VGVKLEYRVRGWWRGVDEAEGLWVGVMDFGVGCNGQRMGMVKVVEVCGCGGGRVKDG